jgi:putative selenate reductase
LTRVIIAVGAYKPGLLKIEGCEPLDALTFMEEFNQTQGKISLGKNVS